MVFKEGLRRYCIAVFSVVAATQVRLWLSPWISDHIPFGTYMIGVVLTAWLAGTWPAVVALITGIWAAAHFIIPPDNSILITDLHTILSLFIYAIVGAVTIYLFGHINSQHNVTRGQLKQIRKLSCDLKTSDRRKDEFLALLAHELRNPLAPIRSGLMLLQRDNVPENERSDVLRTICRQLQQLIRIVDDLLDVSRFVHGQIMLETQPLDLRDSVETSIEQAQSDFSNRQHEVQLLMPAQPVPVHGDRIRIVQIITNLLTNASKYTPRQGRIQILLEMTPRLAVLSVTDNGIGITREMQQHIFELFARSDAAIRRDHGGLGLGLPIAKQFTDMHGGTLRAFSEGADMGSRFELTLPLMPADQLVNVKLVPNLKMPAGCSAEKAAVVDESISTTVDLMSAGQETLQVLDPARTRVMIVDDNVDAADTLATILGFDGYEVICVYDGFQALKKVNEFRPDIVLLDIGLPGMDGHEVARRLREEYLLQPLTLIAVTGWGGEEDLKKSQMSGIDHHLVKPIDPDELQRIMQTVCPPATT